MLLTELPLKIHRSKCPKTEHLEAPWPNLETGAKKAYRTGIEREIIRYIIKVNGKERSTQAVCSRPRELHFTPAARHGRIPDLDCRVRHRRQRLARMERERERERERIEVNEKDYAKENEGDAGERRNEEFHRAPVGRRSMYGRT